jgi:hypothetical protein
MFNDPQRFVTKEEVENSYEFKLIKKILKREYPWIIDILLPSEEEINQYALIFLNVIIDPYILQRETGWQFNTYMKFYFSGNNNFIHTHEPYAYNTAYLTTIYNVPREETNTIQEDIEKTMKQIAKSPAIPEDLKLGKDRQFVVGSWVVPKMDLPEDAVFTPRDKTTV